MNIADKNKPFHIKCQKCGNDISINTNKIKRRYDQAREEVTILNAKATTEKAKNGKSKYYKKLVKRLEDKRAELTKYKREWSALSDNAERQLFTMFKQRLFALYGKEKIVKILEECEDDMFYYESEFMKQDHNNFTGA